MLLVLAHAEGGWLDDITLVVVAVALGAYAWWLAAQRWPRLWFPGKRL